MKCNQCEHTPKAKPVAKCPATTVLSTGKRWMCSLPKGHWGDHEHITDGKVMASWGHLPPEHQQTPGEKWTTGDCEFYGGICVHATNVDCDACSKVLAKAFDLGRESVVLPIAAVWWDNLKSTRFALGEHGRYVAEKAVTNYRKMVMKGVSHEL